MGIFSTVENADRNRLSNLADLSWFAFATSLLVLALLEDSLVAKIGAGFFLAFSPSVGNNFLARFLLAGLGLASIPLGSALLVPAVIIWGLVSGAVRLGFSAAFLSVATYHFAPYIASLPGDWQLPIHPGSATFLVLPAFVVAAATYRHIGIARVGAVILSPFIVFILLNFATVGGWLPSPIFTNQFFRTAMVGVVAFPTLGCKLEGDCRDNRLGWSTVGVAFLCALATFLALPRAPIRSIIFDESHGTWATTKASFEPSDFGRGHNYTYSLLAQYADRLVGKIDRYEGGTLDLDADALFFIKMPTKPLTESFRQTLSDWIHSGGRLIVVADHTDLYDTSQIINGFLRDLVGTEIGIDAVYDPIGYPNKQRTGLAQFALGRVDADGHLLEYQTGASLSRLPHSAITLASYGPSFAEPGDYSKQNRFGPFRPRTSLRFTNHPSVVGIPKGAGAVVILADSTPWSNFSIFKQAYKNLFRRILSVLETPLAFRILPLGAFALLVVALWLPVLRSKFVLLAGGTLFGLVLGTASILGITAFDRLQEGRDFGLQVVVGSHVKLEFLSQLIGPGERNYSRIVSAMAKYRLDPITVEPGADDFKLVDANRWLFIEPEVSQLPSPQEVKKHLRRKGSLAFLFAFDDAARPALREWLSQLGLGLANRRSLGLVEDGTPGLMNRNGVAMMRDLRVETVARASSLLRPEQRTVLAQTYTIRLAGAGRTTGEMEGFLAISFAADQFSDDVVGEVWEGVYPSVLGKLRERQLAALLLGDDIGLLMPEDAVLFPSDPGVPELSNFVVLEDGKAILSGDLNSERGRRQRDSLGLDSDSYLIELQRRAITFIRNHCPTEADVTLCPKHLIGSDLTEWLVSYSSDAAGIKHVELLHERRFSGLGATYNIVFGR